MTLIPRLRRRVVRAGFVRLGGTFRKSSRDRELAEELAGHVEMHADDNVRAGMTPEAARRVALIRLGGVVQTRERCACRHDLLRDHPGAHREAVCARTHAANAADGIRPAPMEPGTNAGRRAGWHLFHSAGRRLCAAFQSDAPIVGGSRFRCRAHRVN